jgi:hypothetical protein
MLHSHNHAATFATYTCSITSALLIFLAAPDPLRTQNEGSSSFESRFSFRESPTPIEPSETLSPRASARAMASAVLAASRCASWTDVLMVTGLGIGFEKRES